MYFHEEELRLQGFRRIVGVDEAGRGPLAGPVVAAAVMLPVTVIPGIRDSKKLSAAQREKIFAQLLVHAEVGVGIVPASMIDAINIFQASKLAMALAVKDLLETPDFLLIDGKNMELPFTMQQRSIIQGDNLSASIAAASIVAKVTRDRMMARYDKIFPSYGFSGHKGYPTQEHCSLLKIHGPCRIHRMTFRPVSEWQPTLNERIGVC